MISVRTVFIALVYLTIASAFRFKCDFIIKKDMYCCTANELNIDDPHTKISNVFGTHLPNMTNADVFYLEISKQTVKFLPINFAEYFPNLQKLTVKNSKLQYITSNDFLGLTQLSNLFMANNTIRELPCGVFDTNQRLKEIHFENNNLNNIGADVFPLPNLKVAHFRNNNCINMDVDKSTAIPALINEITKSCSISCDSSGAYVILETSSNVKVFKNVINRMGNTIYKLLKKIETLELDKTGNKDKPNEEQLLKMDTSINECKAEIKSLENIILNLKKSQLL